MPPNFTTGRAPPRTRMTLTLPHRSHASSRLSTTLALVPPKPNEFDSTQPSLTLSRRAAAGDPGLGAGAARLGMLELLEHQHAGAAGDDEAIAVDVIGARGLVRRLVDLRRHRAHGIEQYRERPIELLATAGEDHVLL